MKKSLLIASALMLSATTTMAETLTLNGTDYEMDRLIERQIGPGTTYYRLRFPDFPLNVNMLIVDLNNPYNRIETTAGKETSNNTESLVTASQRQSYEGHRVVGGANANFWYVNASEDGCPEFVGTPRNVSVRNGKMVTESNTYRDQWTGGPMRQGAVTISFDKVMNVDYCEAPMTISGDNIGTATVHQCNKGVWHDEIGMYNSFYGTTRKFLPVQMAANGKARERAAAGDATEVILDMEEGQVWAGGQDMVFVVKEVRLDAGDGTLGDHDLALVGRGDNRTLLSKLAVGDKVTLKYSWVFNPGTDNEIIPVVEQAIGGNAMVMRNGELTDHNYNESYNSMVYSRTAYGCSADGKTLYIIVIDKSSDPVYGSSAGCNTIVMCDIARYFGCSNMANFDAGGSAEMLINGQIINRTTEGNPRSVANGWFVYSIAPEDDNTVASLAFYENYLEQPIYAASSPQIIAYNKYGAVIDYDFKDVTFSCDPSIGTCEGNVFTAGKDGAIGMLTASYGDVSVSKEMNVIASEISLLSKNLLIDSKREYPIEVVAITSGKTFTYNPADLEWTVDDTSVATIDENGVLRGIANGTTTITGRMGDFSDQATVTVEIATAAIVEIGEESLWTVKGSTGIKNATLNTTTGATTFTYATPRAPSLSFRQEVVLYSLPDDISCKFNSPLALNGITLNINTANERNAIMINLEPEGGFEANKDYDISLDLAANIDTQSIIPYPLTFNKIDFDITPNNNNKGDHTFTFGGVYAHYDTFDSVEDVTIGDELGSSGVKLLLVPNPVVAGAAVDVRAHGITNVAIYNISGTLVSSTNVEQCEAVTVAAPNVCGTYVVRANCASGNIASIMIVK